MRAGERNFQTTWEDIEPWLQQLKEDHNVDVSFQVCIPMAPGGLSPAVVVTATRHNWPKPDIEVKRDWKDIKLGSVGQVEREALQMVSLLLLELDNDKAREARQLDLFAAL